MALRELETERLRLLRIDSDHFADIHSSILKSFETFHKWLFFAYKKETPEEFCEKMKQIQENNEKGIQFSFVISLRDVENAPKVIGMVSLTPLGDDDFLFMKHKETGADLKALVLRYWLRDDYTGHGYITEAAKKLLEVATEKELAEVVVVVIKAENEKSLAVAERCGLVKVGQAHVIRHGRPDWTDPMWYAIFVKPITVPINDLHFSLKAVCNAQEK